MGLSPKRRCGGGNANRRGCPLLVFHVGILSKPQRLNPSGKQEELPSRRSNAALAQYAPRIPAFNKPIPNILGKNIVAVVVDYPPGVSNPPHHHTGSAFVTVYVLQGAVPGQVDDGPVNVYHAGDCYMESWLPSPAQRKRQLRIFRADPCVIKCFEAVSAAPMDPI
jgi:hypothetical protein